MPDPYQVGDSDLLNTDFGNGPSAGSSYPSDNPYGYGSGRALSYGYNAGVSLETIVPQSNGQLSATGGDQKADFDLYLGYAQRVVGLINPFTAQYQNEQGIRLTQEQTALQNARNAGQYAPPKQDMTLVYVLAGAVVIGGLLFVFEKKG